MLSLEVIIPVKDMADHVASAVASVRDQLGDGDLITVVDDHSVDVLPASLSGPDVRVIRLDRSRGPYGARHLAAAASARDVVVFTDARCRARPGWLEGHRQLYSDSGVVMSCTGMQITGGRSLAGRISEATQMFDLGSKAGADGRLSFFPTANLGIRRATYEQVGGFRAMTSGGDVDLCRRVRMNGLGHFGVMPETLMDWVPRDSLRALFSQWIRYGISSAHLDAVYGAGTGTTTEPAMLERPDLRSVVTRLAGRLRADPSSAAAEIGCRLLMAANRASYLIARRSSHERPEPRSMYDAVITDPGIRDPGRPGPFSDPGSAGPG